MTTVATVAGELAAWARALRLGDVPAAVQHAACRHLLDGLGTAIAAARSGVGAPAVAVARDLGGPPEATVLGTDRRVSAPAAALANGTLVHALDFDDTHAAGLVHATAVVLPAAFAVGEQTGASGAQVLRAAVAGYETVCRLAAATPHGFHARGIHATAACGTFSAAMVTGLLLGLDEAQLVDALGIAGSSSAGLLEFLATGSSTKQLHPGSASLAGVLAARLAAAGASGPDSVVEGRRGLYAALSGRPADHALVVKDLGSHWETCRIGIKPYPACQLSHAALDAALVALDELGAPVCADEVAEVLVDAHPDSVPVVAEPRRDKLRPRTPYDAKFSLPWTLAALLVDGQVGVATYDPASIARPEVLALAERVHVRGVEDGPAAGVAADAPARVMLRLRDGRIVEGRVARSAGGPDAPLDEAALTAKLASNGGGAAGVDELAARVRGLAGQVGLGSVLHLAAGIVRGAA